MPLMLTIFYIKQENTGWAQTIVHRVKRNAQVERERVKPATLLREKGVEGE